MKTLFEAIKKNKTIIIVIGSLTILAAILIVVSVTVLNNLNKPISIEFLEESFIIHAPYETREVKYSTVEMYEFKAAYPNVGVAVDAQVNNRVMSGIFQNEGFDPYKLHIYSNTEAYIYFYYRGQAVVFNLSSVKETRECYAQLRERIFGENPEPDMTLSPTIKPEDSQS
ncbi:MAG: hypothetical protein GX802_02695 [Clostridiales bacterium]|jgi:hypothetical protein|nr:hypothetical protein [Clostridiales bacterium]